MVVPAWQSVNTGADMAGLLKIEDPATQSNTSRASLKDMLELGFRPMYLCGALWAIVGVGFWVFAPQWLSGTLNGLFWHAHEMLWGFVAVIAVGFLLTATNNWTGLNPLHGPPLGVLALLWLLARVSFLLPGSPAYLLGCATDLAFFGLAIVAISRSLWRSKSRNNYGFAVLLLGMGVSNAAFLWANAQGADYVQLMHHLFTGMLCMLTIALLIARRVVPFFASRAVAGLATLDRHTRSGQWQVALAVLAIVAWQLGLNVPAALLFAAAGGITLWHLVAWKPWAVLHNPLLWILYLGYFGLALGLFSTAAYVMGWTIRLSWPVHLIAVAGFGPLIIGMITRTALGHTGRMLQADRAMLASYILLLLAIVFRVLALLAGTATTAWLHASATFWGLAFLIYLVRFYPILTRPRADKRPGKPIPLRRG